MPEEADLRIESHFPHQTLDKEQQPFLSPTPTRLPVSEKIELLALSIQSLALFYRPAWCIDVAGDA